MWLQGRSAVVAALLAGGAGKPIRPAAFDDRRKGLSASEKKLLDLSDIFSAGLAGVTQPVVMVYLPASPSDLLSQRNSAGLTPLHILAGGDFGALCILSWSLCLPARSACSPACSCGVPWPSPALVVIVERW